MQAVHEEACTAAWCFERRGGAPDARWASLATRQRSAQRPTCRKAPRTRPRRTPRRRTRGRARRASGAHMRARASGDQAARHAHGTQTASAAAQYSRRASARGGQEAQEESARAPRRHAAFPGDPCAPAAGNSATEAGAQAVHAPATSTMMAEGGNAAQLRYASRGTLAGGRRPRRPTTEGYFATPWPPHAHFLRTA